MLDVSELDIPDKTLMKVERTADLLTIFTPTVEREVKDDQGEIVVVNGRWCTLCK